MSRASLEQIVMELPEELFLFLYCNFKVVDFVFFLCLSIYSTKKETSIIIESSCVKQYYC